MVSKRDLAKLSDADLLSEWTELARQSEALRADLRRCSDEFKTRNAAAATTPDTEDA